MKTIQLIAVGLFICLAGCKKNNNNTPVQTSKAIGPFSIYGEFTCPENYKNLLVASYNNVSSHNLVSSVSDFNGENPEFYIKKSSGEGSIIYVLHTIANDTTYWVWYDDAKSNDCNFTEGGCGKISLEAFTDLKKVSGNKYEFKINIEDKQGIQESLILAPGGRHLYTGKGIQKNSGNCSRSTTIFLSNSAPCKEIRERVQDDPWEYCFSTRFFFVKKA